MVLVELQRITGMPTAADLAQKVVVTATMELPPMEIEKALKAMLDHGS
jgi:hypothetical protein